MTSDGTDDDEVDQGCCVDRCTGACGGYGFAFELAARNPPSPSDGTDFFEEDEPLEDIVTAFEGGKPLLTVVDEIALWSSGRDPVPVDGPLSGCCGEDVCGSSTSDGTSDDIDLPGFVGMIHGGRADLARHAKDIARGRPVDGSSVE